MNRTTICTPLLAVALVTFMVACNDDPPPEAPFRPAGCTGTLGTYVLTPTDPQPPPAPYQVTDKYQPGGDRHPDFFGTNCDAICHDDCPNENNDSFRYAVGPDCALPWFDGFVGDYTFTGQWVRAYDTGTGPFATGTYSNMATGESGTFAFYEDGRTP